MDNKAKRKSTRRRNAKVIRRTDEESRTVQGRILAPEEWQIYQAKYRGRMGLVERAEHEAQRLALSDFDYSKLTSPRAKDLIAAISTRATDAGIALGSMRHFYFAQREKGFLAATLPGLDYCASELKAVAADIESLVARLRDEAGVEEVPHV